MKKVERGVNIILIRGFVTWKHSVVIRCRDALTSLDRRLRFRWSVPLNAPVPVTGVFFPQNYVTHGHHAAEVWIRRCLISLPLHSDASQCEITLNSICHKESSQISFLNEIQNRTRSNYSNKAKKPTESRRLHRLRSTSQKSSLQGISTCTCTYRYLDVKHPKFAERGTQTLHRYLLLCDILS